MYKMRKLSMRASVLVTFVNCLLIVAPLSLGGEDELLVSTKAGPRAETEADTAEFELSTKEGKNKIDELSAEEAEYTWHIDGVEQDGSAKTLTATSLSNGAHTITAHCKSKETGKEVSVTWHVNVVRTQDARPCNFRNIRSGNLMYPYYGFWDTCTWESSTGANKLGDLADCRVQERIYPYNSPHPPFSAGLYSVTERTYGRIGASAGTTSDTHAVNYAAMMPTYDLNEGDEGMFTKHQEIEYDRNGDGRWVCFATRTISRTVSSFMSFPEGLCWRIRTHITGPLAHEHPQRLRAW